jgi:hypothetical protein
LGQRALPGLTRVAGTPLGGGAAAGGTAAGDPRGPVSAEKIPAGSDAAALGGLGRTATPAPPAPTECAGTTRAAEADIGFPQSMQNREFGSFSRPQKLQAIMELTTGRGTA